MYYSEVKKPRFANSEKTKITCDVLFTSFADFVPFTASSDDPEEHGREIFASCLLGTHGDISDYTPPDIDYAGLAELQRQNLLSEANSTILDWRTELQLGMISAEDKSRLVKWMEYIKKIKALAFNDINDEDSFNSLRFPPAPTV